MPLRRFAALLAAFVLLLLTAVPASAADGGPPADYTKTAGLTQPQYFAAPPGTRVDLALTFFDSGGQPGT